MKNAIFTGVATALITPMDAAGQVDLAELARLVDYQIDCGVDALLICGTTGESAVLSDAEKAECIRCAVHSARRRVPILAGTGSNHTRHAIELSQQAQALGADALLCVTPYYNKTSQAGLIRHFTALADNVDLPVLLYNVPSRTGMNLTPETLAALSRHSRIVGIKEASGNLSQCAQMLSLCGDAMPLYSGNDDLTLPILALGGKGVISVASNVAPRQMCALCRAWFAGETETARACQMALLPLCKQLFCDVNPMPVKYAMGLQGWQAGPCRLPLTELSAVHKANLQALLASYPR